MSDQLNSPQEPQIRPAGRPELNMAEFTEVVFNWVDEDIGVDREENENEPLSAASLLLDLGKYGMSVVPNEWLRDLEVLAQVHADCALDVAASGVSSPGGEAGRWVPVGERLPGPYRKVLLLYNGLSAPLYEGQMETGALIPHDNGGYHWSASEVMDKAWVSHWLPLPTTPQS